MKRKLILSFCFLITACLAIAQDGTPMAPYLRFPTIPPFTLLKTDSSALTRDDLAVHKKTILIYFSPSCDHCRHQTDSLLANMKKFKNVEFLMATNQPMKEMQDFYKEYKIASYPNIKMGQDTKYFFPPYYRMANLPFLALYNKKGNLITTFEGTTHIQTLLDAFDGKIAPPSAASGKE